MAVPLIDTKPQYIPLRDKILDAITRIADSGGFILGPTVESFENHLAVYTGARHAIGLSSGTDALLAALMALDIRPGDEVITPAFTFFATVGSITRCGAKPVFVDIDPQVYNICTRAAAAAVTPRTKAILPVDLYGHAAGMQGIAQIADKHGLAVIEDAAQALGAKQHGRMAGTLGTIGCLSFYPTKNLSAFGDAGACLTDDDKLAERLRQLRNHGQTDVYHHAYVGGNFRLDAIQAAVLDVKLDHLDAMNAERRALAERYRELLAGTPMVLPVEEAGNEHMYNPYTVRAPQRDGLMRYLKERGIGHRVYYPIPLHLQPCFSGLGYKRGDFPHSERAAEEVLSLPIYAGMTHGQQDEVVEAVRGFYGVK